MSPDEIEKRTAFLSEQARALNRHIRNVHALGLRCTITTGAQDGGPPQIGVLVQEPVVPAADEGWDDRR